MNIYRFTTKLSTEAESSVSNELITLKESLHETRNISNDEEYLAALTYDYEILCDGFTYQVSSTDWLRQDVLLKSRLAYRNIFTFQKSFSTFSI